MKPHVSSRYGQTAHQMATTTTTPTTPSNRTGGIHHDTSMIEEYKLEEQLAPFYESNTSATSALSARCYAPASSTSALRTVSIMETLNQLTAGREQQQQPGGKNAAMAMVRRKKATSSSADDPHNFSSLDHQQQQQHWQSYPKVQSQRERVWDVSRHIGGQRKGGPQEDILVPTASASGANGSAGHGYGSLERRRRRRPGARSGMPVSSSRRVQTDWEHEEEDEDERRPTAVSTRRMVESNDHYPIVPPLFQLKNKSPPTPQTSAVERERERARQSYKPPSEWFTSKTSSDVNKVNKKKQSATSSSSLNERGQTPDWIHQIFQVARRGDLLKLQRSLAGMESTLARNLSDHRGNNLLHVVAGAGDADALAWLCSAFGPQMQDALLDENKRGLTPVVAAIQSGRLEVLQFLVEHTSVRQRLAPADGDRSLLHCAAKYGKIDLVAWLAQHMESHGLQVDLRDHCGHSPLHLAARAGQASAVAILVAHGADVTAKNDMGHRPLDLASANGHVGVAQLLRLHDAALCLSAETLEATQELDAVRTDYADLRSHFRDVLVVGKRLAKERDEMCRQLGRLYEDATSVHQGLLLELRTLHRDLAGVRDHRVSSSRKAGEIADRNLDESVAIVEALHDKWLSQQRGWFSSSLADMEHRLLLAEEGWKRLRTCGASGSQKQQLLINHHDRGQLRPHELLRSRLAAVNAQASGMQCDVAALSSSDGSLYSNCCHSECSGGDNDSRAPPPASSRSGKSNNDSIYGTAFRKSINSSAPESVTTPKSLKMAMEKKKPPPPVPVAPPISHRREELRKRLQQVKLTSESGNASVIEVIEPTSSSEEDGADYGSMLPLPRDQSTPIRPSASASTRSFNASFTDELEKARLHGKSSHRKGASTSLLLAEPDLLAGTLIGPPVQQQQVALTSRSCHDLAQAAQDVIDVQVQSASTSTRSHSSLSSSNATAITSVAASGGQRAKKNSASAAAGGFLTKFALKARWPSKLQRKGGDSPPAPPPVPQEALNVTSPDDLSADESSATANGVVAGLSQMFEDLSAKASSPSSPSSGVASSRKDSAAEGMTDLPPSTSPPPVPLEIETYNSVSPSSQQREETTQPPPPPPPPSSSSDKIVSPGGGGGRSSGSVVVGGATPSSSASSSTSATTHGGVESLSVAASEDSGIVMARPASSASKSDSSPRHLVHANNNNNSNNNNNFSSPLPRGKTLPFVTVVTGGGGVDQRDQRNLSPAPSESVASTSDLSKTESIRHFRQLARIEEAAAAAAAAAIEDQAAIKPATALAESSGQILTWREAKLKNQVVTPPPLEERLNKTRVRLEEKSIRTLKKRHQVSERPWYDVSDDESDLLTPERLTKLKTSLSSSEDTSSSSAATSSADDEDITV